MLNQQTGKYCRKRIEGYSEISEHGSITDIPSDDILKLLEKNDNKCKLHFKWVILLLGAVLIIGGVYLFIKTAHDLVVFSSSSSASQIIEGGGSTNTSVLSNYTDFSRGTSLSIHDRKKRNISNETDFEDLSRNSTLYDYFNNLSNQYVKFTSAVDGFMREFKKNYMTNNKIPQSFSAPARNESPKSPTTESSQTESESKVDDNIKTTINSDNLEVRTEMKNSSVSDIKQNTDLYENPNIDTTSVTEPTINDKTTSGTEVTTEQNLNPPDTEKTHLTKATMLDIDASPVPTTISIGTEQQNQSKSDSSNRDVITLYSKNTVTLEPSSNGENAVGDLVAKESIINEVSINPNTTENQQTDTSFADSITTIKPTTVLTDKLYTFTTDADDNLTSSTKEIHIMKISHSTTEGSQNTESTSFIEPETDSPEIYVTALEDIDNNATISNESDSDENNRTDYKKLLQKTYELLNDTEIRNYYTLKNLRGDSKPDEILLKIRNILELGPTSKRSFRNVDPSDMPWKLYCFQKITNADSKTDLKVVNIPVKPSDLENFPKIRYRRDELPPYSAHSLHTHQFFENLKNKIFVNDTASFSNDKDHTEVFSIPDSSGDNKGLYYCTYMQSFKNASKSEQTDSDPKFTSTNEVIDLNELENEICPGSQKMCLDGSKCIASVNWCNGIINCADRSDETNCSCKERMNADKLCDGFFDCPDGGDERGCFGCPENSFSCDDWQLWKPNVTCVPMSKRCDDQYDCSNKKDEKDCQLLADKIFSHDTFLVSYTSGYLHRNWKGKWYPVCNDVNSLSSIKACQSELGAKNIRHVKVATHPTTEYSGPFVSMIEKSIKVINECPTNGAIYVKCPNEYCGTRIPEDNEKLKYQYKRDTEYQYKNDTRYRHKRQIQTGNLNEKDTSALLKEFISYLQKQGNKVRERREEDARVVGGKASGPGFWPWVVALYKNGIFHCGAVILDETWIMTAAHCVQEYKGNYYEIQAGVLRRLSFSPMEQNRAVTHIIVHSKYSRSDMRNDVALLRIDPPLKMNRWIRPICLPEARSPWGPPAGVKCTAVGWGATQEHGPDPDNMREVEVPILPSCKHQADRENDEICAGYILGGHDTCQGDSGGPLLCKFSLLEDRWYVAGIVSHGEGCARPLEPGAYTRIALYLPWLMNNADDRSLSKANPSVLQCPGMKCRDGGRCISKKKICDNVIDCLDGEDEVNCGKWASSPSSRTADNGQSVDSAQDSQPNEYQVDIDNKSNETIHAFGLGDLQNKDQFFDNVTDTPEFRERSPTTNTELNVFDPFLKHNATLEGELSNVEKFTCKIIKQTLPKFWYCDGEIDCEDGTDEINCTCSDLLRSVNQSLICNGINDCYDLSDEVNCNAKLCTMGEFNCYESHSCINIAEQCDGKINCAHGEDEKNCFALSEDENITLDYFAIPKFTQKGLIKVNEKGIWRTYITAEILPKNLEDICKYLGFRKVEAHKLFKEGGYSKKKPLNYSVELSCSSRYDETKILPWYANIYKNGDISCSGLLINADWIIADYNCSKSYDPKRDYMVAVLGGHRKTEDLIQSFYEQIITVDYVHVDEERKITIIHLETPVDISKYVNPFPESLWVMPPEENTQCLLIGGLKEPAVLPVKAGEKCSLTYCQFGAVNKTKLCSHHHQNVSYSFVLCPSPSYTWDLTAIVGTEIHQYCFSNSTTIELPIWSNPSILESNFTKFSPPNCTQGYRCKFGRCITWSEICDGKTDCRNNEDETPERCASKKTFCKYSPTECSCKMYEFKCKNNQCVNRNTLCDGNDDCGDNSDEPAQCSNFSCATYLNMTQPHKLCDGRKDCADKSDENLSTCPSYCNTTSHFECAKSGQCIPLEFVCDGESDCSNQEDESQCWMLKNDIKNLNEANLFIRTHGKWHRECLTLEFINFKPEAVCSISHYGKVTQFHLIPGTKTPFAEYRKIRLSNDKDFKLISKPLVSNSTETCNYVHLQCK